MSYNPLRYTCNVQIFSTNIWKEAVQLKSLELHFQNVLKFLAAYNSATTITSGPSFIVFPPNTHSKQQKKQKTMRADFKSEVCDDHECIIHYGVV